MAPGRVGACACGAAARAGRLRGDSLDTDVGSIASHVSQSAPAARAGGLRGGGHLRAARRRLNRAGPGRAGQQPRQFPPPPPAGVSPRGGAGALASASSAPPPASRRPGVDPGIRLFGLTSHTLLVRSSQSSSGPGGRRRFRRLRAGTRSCGPGPPVYDYRGRGTPSHRLGRIHPYVRSCSATDTDRERSDWRT